MQASSTGQDIFLFPDLPALGTPDARVEANLLDEDRRSTPASPRLTPATVRSPTQSLYLPDSFTIPAGSTGFTPLAHRRSPGSSGSQLTFAPVLASSSPNTRSPNTRELSPLYLDSSTDTPGAVGLAGPCTSPTAKIVPNKRVVTRIQVQRRQWGDSDASSSDGEASPAELLPVSKTALPARVRSKHLVTCSRTLHKYWVYSSDSSSSSGDASPGWPSPVPSIRTPVAATPAPSTGRPLHLPRRTNTFIPPPAASLTATSAVSHFSQWINRLQSPVAVSPTPVKRSQIGVPQRAAATCSHRTASPSGSAVSKAAARRAVSATAAAATAGTPTITPVSPPTSTPTRTPVSRAPIVEFIGQEASAAIPSTAGRGRATALRAGAVSIAKARGCAQSRGAVLSPPASQQPRRINSDQASVQSAAHHATRPAAPKLPGSRGTRANKTATIASATRAAAGTGVVTRSCAAATAAKDPSPVTAAAHTDTTPAALCSQRKKGSLKAEAPTRVQPKRAAKPVWR